MKPAEAECFVYGYIESPIGALLVAGDADHIRLISFPSENRAQRRLSEWRRDDLHFGEAFEQLRAYFAKELTEFNFPIRFDGTEFQNLVWRALCDIPYGSTTSYGALATKIGKPKASRAVGAANGSNPLPIVVPCHRVIGSNAKLTGFGGGIETKQFLLVHENASHSQLQLF